MAVSHDFVAYHASIADQLSAAKDRVRHLIGGEHWLTDGEHKESILRNILRMHLPESVRVGKGFVCYPGAAEATGLQTDRTLASSSKQSSGQLDILITDKSKPTLYKEGELVFVTADAVHAIIEVKTRLNKKTGTGGGRDVLDRLCNKAESIRQRTGEPKRSLWVGLFVFEDEASDPIEHYYLLDLLQDVAHGERDRLVTCLSLGDHIFLRFRDQPGEDTRGVAGAGWYCYKLESLAPAYFLSNLVLWLSAKMPIDALGAWFPIEGTKEVKTISYKPLVHASDPSFGTDFVEEGYSTKDGKALFQFRYVNVGRHYEIDILDMPSYGTRSDGLRETHRLASLRGGHMICFREKQVADTLHRAKELAALRAECTWRYIQIGTWA